MKRTQGRALPQIAVEDDTMSVRVPLPSELHADLTHYAHYYAQVSGRKPLTLSHVIVGLLSSFLDHSEDFQQWKREEGSTTGSRKSPFANPGPSRTAARESGARRP